MVALQFQNPIGILVEPSFPRQLKTVADAYQFVDDWGGNSPEQKAAVRACKDALAGDLDVETAREAVVDFARKKDILIEDGDFDPQSVVEYKEWHG